MAVIHATTDSFEQEVLQAKGAVLVDFWATWCGPCQMVGPIVEQLAEEQSEVKIVKVDVDQAQEIAGRYGVLSIPTFVLFKDGKDVRHEVGALPKAALRKLIEV